LHTETGDRGLLLGGHARRILGLGDDESCTVIHLLQSYLVRPHNVLRWDWQDGDLLLVDARAVQRHARPGGGPRPATTSAVEVAGDPPLGVDGQHSHYICNGVLSERRTA
jgi:taurine dioxygenase